MAKVSVAPGAIEIAEELERRRDELIDRGLAVIRSRMPAYRDADPVLSEDVRAHIGHHHDLICAVIRRGWPAQPSEFAFVGRHAAVRARRGVTLSDFLEAFRAYLNVLWDAVVERAASGHEVARAALEAARTVMSHIDGAATEASAAYLESQQLLLADADRVRRDLLEDLLAGGVPGSGARLAAARRAGLTDGGRCLVVAAVPTAAPDDDTVLRRAANDLAAAVDVPAPPLTVTRQGEIVLVVALAPRGRPALVEPLGAARERARSDGVELAIGVSTVHDGLARLGRAYEEASLMVRRVGEAGGVLSLPDLGPFEYLTLSGDDVARRLISAEVRRFVAEDREHDHVLTRTLSAYATADLNAKAAAEALQIHQNTAHYRLGRIADKTGCDLRRLSDVLDLLVAVRLLGDADPVTAPAA